MIILIHNFGYQSVKTFVDEIKKSEKLIVIINDYKEKTFPKNINTVPLKEFTPEVIAKKVKTIASKANENIGCVTFDENLVELCGLLNDMFSKRNEKCLRTRTSYLLTDKLMMRTFLSNSVKQPDFAEYHGLENAKKFLDKHPYGIVLKPRVLYSGKGQYYINSKEDFNYVPVNLNHYLMEEKIKYTTMYTSDGIYTHDNCLITIHKYDDKITDLKENLSPLTARSEVLCKSSHDILTKIEESTRKVLSQLVTTPHEVIPFHIEWFVDTKNKVVTFCEGGARFGGVYIPELIQSEYGVDIKHLYARSLVGMKIPSVLERHASAISFSPRLKPLKIKKINLEFPDWINFKKVFVKSKEDYTPTNDWMGNTAYTVIFNFDSEQDLLEKKKYLLNNFYTSITYEQK